MAVDADGGREQAAGALGAGLLGEGGADGAREAAVEGGGDAAGGGEAGGLGAAVDGGAAGAVGPVGGLDGGDFGGDVACFDEVAAGEEADLEVRLVRCFV